MRLLLEEVDMPDAADVAVAAAEEGVGAAGGASLGNTRSCRLNLNFFRNGISLNS